MAISYPSATVSKKTGQRNLQACVTVPTELRPIIGRKQIYKSLGTFDPTVAKERLRAKEAEIFRELDEANLAGHPLALAALELERALWPDLELSDGSNASFPEDLIRKRAALWFDPDKRWDEYDNLVQRAGGQPFGYKPNADQVQIHHDHRKNIKPLLDTFNSEFRKLSEERYAPKIRSKPFKDTAEEYFSSPFFGMSKNGPLREKTKTDYINKVNVFIGWAGNVSLDEFNNSLATKYMTILASKDSKIVSGGAANETIKAYFNPVRQVLKYAFKNDYSDRLLWSDLDFGGVGRPSEKYRDFTENELKVLFTLDMPQQDRLALSILACTGARLDEIALLEWSQVHEEYWQDGTVKYLDTTDAIVKNRPSRRLIPLVPEVWKLFPPRDSIVNKKEPERLFTYLRTGKDRKAQNKASDALMVHIRRVSKDPLLVVHSLRHTFSTMCRNASLDWELREFVVGRGAGSGASSHYGQVHWVGRQLLEMSKMDYSFLDQFNT